MPGVEALRKAVGDADDTLFGIFHLPIKSFPLAVDVNLFVPEVDVMPFDVRTLAVSEAYAQEEFDDISLIDVRKFEQAFQFLGIVADYLFLLVLRPLALGDEFLATVRIEEADHVVEMVPNRAGVDILSDGRFLRAQENLELPQIIPVDFLKECFLTRLAEELQRQCVALQRVLSPVLLRSLPGREIHADRGFDGDPRGRDFGHQFKDRAFPHPLPQLILTLG